MNAILRDPNLIAALVFLVLAVIGVLLAQGLARKGDRGSALKRRLRYASARQGVDPDIANDRQIDLDVFGDNNDERRGEGRIARFMDMLDEKLALIGGVRILRKAIPIAAGFGALIALVAASKLELPFKYALLAGFLAFVLGLVFGLRTMIQRTYDKFNALFPDAIDLVVRSIRAGLPVSQAIENIGTDIAAPVGPEFAAIANEMRIGVSLDDALRSALKRVDLPEMRFFAVTLILQRETGGQLAEVLLNLSDTLRQRKGMKLKIRALTSESRAASKIVAAIPILSFIGMYYLNKPNILLLIETDVGNNMLGYCVLSILVGLLIIKKLTAVDA